MKSFSLYKMQGIVLLLLPFFCFSQVRNESFSGYVYDNVTQKPLTGAKVAIINTERNVVIKNTTAGSDGSYFFDMLSMFNIKVTVTMDGYKKAEKSFTKEDIKSIERRIPPFYMDTAITIRIPPSVPVRKSKEDFVTDQFGSLNIVPVPAAYDLLVYLNPDLERRDSLMSNDKIVLPKMPRVKNDVKHENKKQFQSDRDNDRTTQNRLRDTIDKITRILSDDVLRYKIKYEKADAGMLKQMRDYMRMDLLDYKGKISKTSKLKAEGIIELLTSIGALQEKIITERGLKAATFERMKLLWEDLSYLLKTNRYMLFTENGYHSESETAIVFTTVTNQFYSGPAAGNDGDEMIVPVTSGNNKTAPETTFAEDEVGVFGFVVWSEELTSRTKPDLAEPGGRYVIRYFKPAFADDKTTYQICKGNANVAIANLTRARYGVEVYDTKEKKYVEPLYPTFTTEEAFASRKYDALLVPDFKEIKYLLIRLK